METIWDYRLLNNTVKEWAIAAGIIVISMLGIWLFKTVVFARLKRMAARSSTKMDDLLVKILQQLVLPLAYLMAIYFGLHYLHFSARMEKVLHIAILFITTFYIIRIINLLVAYLFDQAMAKRSADDAQHKPARGVLIIINIITWIIGIVFLIDNMGYDITTIVTGLGIGGIAIALAAQTILGDLFSYMVIYFDKPFEIGDFIIVDTKMGVVEHVGIKTTRIRTLNGEQLICSNTDLTNSRVHNFKRMQERRIVFSFGVVYGTPYEKLHRIPGMVREIIERTPNTRFDRAHFQKFGSHSLDFEVVFYVLAPEYQVYMDAQQAINLAMVELFEKEAIEFAFPTQTIHLKNGILH